jgi:hypothetical protein
MIEDDFYATIKLKNGEEIFAKVAASEEEEQTILLITNPIIVHQFNGRGNVQGYRLEPWLKTTKEDMFVINMNDVLTMSESSDIEMIMMYQSFVRKTSSDSEKKSQNNVNRKMGYISNVNDAKEILEKIFKKS